MNDKVTGKRGFTLIELLMVVAMIALLTTLLLPALSHATEQARRAVCLANLHQWSIALGVYAADADGRYPPGDTARGWMRPGLFRFTTLAAMQNHPWYQWYGERREFWNCPNIVQFGGIHPWYLNSYTSTYDLRLGYQYLGDGDRQLINWWAWTKPAHAPWGPDAPGEWNLMADWAYKVNWPGVWVTRQAGHLAGGGGRSITQPNNHISGVLTEIEGGNQLFNDGSARWAQFDEMDLVSGITDVQYWVYH